MSLCLQAERETRASDLASMVSTSRSIQPLVSYAGKLKRTLLIEKVASKCILISQLVPFLTSRARHQLIRFRKMEILESYSVGI